MKHINAVVRRVLLIAHVFSPPTYFAFAFQIMLTAVASCESGFCSFCCCCCCCCWYWSLRLVEVGARFHLSVARQWIYNFHISTHLPLNIKCNIYRIDESIQTINNCTQWIWFDFSIYHFQNHRCCSFC